MDDQGKINEKHMGNQEKNCVNQKEIKKNQQTAMVKNKMGLIQNYRQPNFIIKIKVELRKSK